MTTASTSPISKLLDSLDPIVTMERDGLVVIALGTSLTGDGPAYLTLDEALAAQAVGIHEVGEGSVPTVAVETHDWPVVIFGGDTIVGGKQNRVVNVTMWLAGSTTTPIPVTCLEHGRWDHWHGAPLRERSEGGPAPALDAQRPGPRTGARDGDRG